MQPNDGAGGGMVKVLLDACVPNRLRRRLTEFDVETARAVGLDQLPDGALLAAIDGSYDVLVTRDRNLTFQQEIAGRSVAVVVLRSLDQSPADFDALLPELMAAIGAAAPGTVSIVGGRTSCAARPQRMLGVTASPATAGGPRGGGPGVVRAAAGA